MRKLVLALWVLLLIGCSSEEEHIIHGQWYTYTESGAYMELWLGEDRAITYLSAIDEFLLYDLKREGSLMSFSLSESRRFDEHEFSLNVQKSSDELFQAIFIGGPSIDSAKTYFVVDTEKLSIQSSLAKNQPLIEEFFQRQEGGSHAGHDH